ncbi:hypothetical protein AKJ16_DCAP20527, partial [Drosera capensis]
MKTTPSINYSVTTLGPHQNYGFRSPIALKSDSDLDNGDEIDETEDQSERKSQWRKFIRFLRIIALTFTSQYFSNPIYDESIWVDVNGLRILSDEPFMTSVSWASVFACSNTNLLVVEATFASYADCCPSAGKSGGLNRKQALRIELSAIREEM